MRKFFLELWGFALAIASHWVALATGGVIMASVWFYEDVLGRTAPNHLNAWLAALFLGMGGFMAWRDVIREGNELKAKVRTSETLGSIQNSIAALVIEGKEILRRSSKMAKPDNEIVAECNAWATRVSDFLKGNLNDLAEAKFRHPPPLAPSRDNSATRFQRRKLSALDAIGLSVDEFYQARKGA